MNFLFSKAKGDLTATDFDRFDADFSRTLLHLMPCATGPVSFLSLQDAAEEKENQLVNSLSWEEGIKKVIRHKQPVIVPDEPVIFLPIWNDTNLSGIAVLEGVDLHFVNTLSGEWLSDRSRIISREFGMIKKLATDPLTGLLNGNHLRCELDRMLAEKAFFTLALLEIFPRVKNAEKAQQSIIKACYHLNSYSVRMPVHYMGWGVFALVWPGVEEEQSQKLGKAALNLFKRERFSNAHLGMLTVSSNSAVEEREEFTSEQVMDEAWQALRTAYQRGPFSLCSFSSISNLDRHPLYKLSHAVLHRFRRLWRKKERFTVILLQPDEEFSKSGLSKRVLTLLDAGTELIHDDEKQLFVYLPDVTEEKALTWAQSIRKKIWEATGTSFSMGIAVFPGNGFKKIDIPMNAKKALLHGEFFGPGTVTPFDAVSLNVSGDIYYNEGDLNKAVKEYRLGLVLDPNNINLMNSLGEAYAQMNRHKMAIQYFEKVLTVDPRNYMALFNLGVCQATLGENERAVDYFEKALTIIANNSGNDERSKVLWCDEYSELLLHLGRLYCKAGRYDETIALLSDCPSINNGAGNAETIEKSSIRRGGAFRYLGKAYKGVGKNQKSITYLQRAINYNPRDASSLSLLGELYHLENQGDDIALSLCKQALDLDDTKWQHSYRVGWLNFRLGNLKEAESLLLECLARNNRCVPAIHLMGQVYEKLNMNNQAVKMYKKVLRLEPTHSQARSALAELKVR